MVSISLDAVAVEAGAGENLYVIGRIFHRDSVFLETQIVQDLPGRCLQAGTYRIFGVEVFQLQGILPLQEDVGILEDAREPVGRGDDFVYPDLAIVVNINVLEAFFIELQVVYRAAEDRPHLAVQFSQMTDVFSVADFDTDSASHRCEGPGIGVLSRLFHMVIVLVISAIT